MRKLLPGLILLVLIPAALAAQDDSEWYVNKPISDIVFIGLDAVSENDLAGLVEPFIGQVFTDTLFWDLQSRLYELDYFEDIIPSAVPADPTRSAVVIQFEVVERPVVDTIEFTGNSRIRRAELLESILLKQGDMAVASRVQLDEAAIEDLYLEKGFTNVEVAGRIEELEDGSSARVVFEIDEGRQMTIREIAFTGNSFASGSTLKGVLVSKEQSLFSSGVYRELNIAQDKEKIRTYYTTRGYIDAAVTDVLVDETPGEDGSRTYLSLTYVISEGEQYTFGGLEIEGNTIFTDEQLLKEVRIEPGRPLDLSRLQSGIMGIADMYYENGYIHNNFQTGEQRDEQQNTISFTLMITESDRAHIENIIIRGNEKTHDEVILREIPLQEGDIFSSGRIQDAYRNLMNLQYFSAVTPEPVYGSAEGLMDLVINVEEQSTADIQFGLSFSGNPDFPVTAWVNLSDRNFLGRGQTLGGELNLSPVQQSLSFNFLENWLFDRRWSGGVNFTVSHKTVSGISQDILAPIFTGSEPNAVPDPFTGRYVFSNDTKIGETQYKAGAPFPGVPTKDEITQHELVTDYDYAVSEGKGIPEQYLMDYGSWDLSLGLNTGYTFKLPAGDINTSTGFRTTLSYIYYDPTVFRPFRAEDRNNLNSWLFINKLWMSGSWDTRDYIFNPTSGFYLSQRLTFTGGFLGGSQDYIRTDTKAEAFVKLLDIPVTENWSFKTVLGAHTGISFILPPFGGDEPVIAENDLLYIDGMMTARGWQLSSTGRVLWDNWLELRFPISEQVLWFDLFLDAAGLWQSPNEFRSGLGLDDFYFSLGADLRITIPNFPIRFGLAKLFRFDENGKIVGEPGDIFKDGLGLRFVISLATSLF